MLRKDSLETGEIYHLYNRGVSKQALFLEERDYLRFLVLLHVSNHGSSIHLANLLSKYKGRSFMDMFQEVADHSLVGIHAYCLMPNHFHLVLRQKRDFGISTFMKKLGTAYSMYFNSKYEHSGALFQGRFKSSHVGNEAYFRWIYAYVHLNSLGLLYPDWEKDAIENSSRIRSQVEGYVFSSYQDYAGGERPQRKILDMEDAPAFLHEQSDLEDLMLNIKDRPL
jgi:putative transposase